MKHNQKVQLISAKLANENYPESYSSEDRYTLAIEIVEIEESINRIKDNIDILSLELF